MKKARITYRFDQQGQALPDQEPELLQEQIIPLSNEEFKVEHREEQEVRKHDAAPLNQFTSDFGAWSSPFDIEVQRLEQIIRGTERPNNKQPRVGQPRITRIDPETNERIPPNYEDHNYDGETGYYRPEYEYTTHGPVVTDEPIRTRMMHSSRTPWFRIGATISGAILMGIMLGWFALTIFTDGLLPNLWAEPDVAMHQSSNLEQDALAGSIDQSDAPPTLDHISPPIPLESIATMEEEGVLRVDLPERHYHILQHGIFSTTESAMNAQQQLQKSGFAGASELKELVHVYVGLAVNREEALGLKQLLDLAETEAYIKAYVIPATEQIEWQGEATAAISHYINDGNALVESISRLTSLQLSHDEPQAFQPLSIQTIQTNHRAWSVWSAEVSAGLSEEYHSVISRMDNAMNSAVMLLAEYNKNPSFSYLWQAQAAILQFLLLEQGLLSSIAV